MAQPLHRTEDSPPERHLPLQEFRCTPHHEWRTETIRPTSLEEPTRPSHGSRQGGSRHCCVGRLLSCRRTVA